MTKKIKLKFKKGAASFYVVAFSTLVLVILAASFAAIIISEMTRTANDDLSQSAYDSALAGIEDAKLAFYNYQACKEQGISASVSRPTGTGALTCAEIIWYMEKGLNDKNYNSCDMVAHILGRISKDENSEVMIQETIKGGDNSMQQAYTCVKINTKLSDYRSTLTEENPTRTVKVQLANVAANNIKKVKISWYSRTDGTDLVYSGISSGSVRFPTLREGRAPTPPILSLGLVQTTDTFNFSDFDKVTSNATNRATVFFVPTDNQNVARSSKAPDNYIGVYNGSENVLTSAQIIKSNDRTVKNIPYVVYCPKNLEYGDFTCSATVDLPDAIGGTRNDETFMFVVSIPYGQPSTDFALEFFCAEGQTCGTVVEGAGTAPNQAILEGVQVNIDSTGRANNLYRRIEARLDTADANFPYPLYAIELLREKASGFLLYKDMTVTREFSENTYPNNLNLLQAR